jgi:hypothetical protein
MDSRFSIQLRTGRKNGPRDGGVLATQLPASRRIDTKIAGRGADEPIQRNMSLTQSIGATIIPTNRAAHSRRM